MELTLGGVRWKSNCSPSASTTYCVWNMHRLEQPLPLARAQWALQRFARVNFTLLRAAM